MIAFTICVILLTLALLKYVVHMRHIESYVKNLKSAKPFIPFFGHILKFITKSTSENYEYFVDLATHNESPVKLYIGPKLFVILDKPDDIKAILMSPHCLDKPFLYDYLPYKYGLLTAQCKTQDIQIQCTCIFMFMNEKKFGIFNFSGNHMETSSKANESFVQFKKFTAIYTNF